MHTECPLVSVIIPVYNVEEYLHECVDSILQQTYPNTEIILVDDQSTDNSGRICDEYASRYSNIKVIHKENGGASSARNVGLESSQGQFIMFADSDDFMDKEMIEELVALQKSTQAEVVGCEFLKYSSETKTDMVMQHDLQPIHPYTPLQIIRLMFEYTMDCAPWNKLYDRATIGDLRFIEGITNEDMVFLFQLYLKCNSIVYMNKAFYHYRSNPNSVTSNFNHRYDIFYNALFLSSEIDRLHLDLKKEVTIYTDKLAMDCCFYTIRYRIISQYRKKYQDCRNHCLKNFSSIFFSPNYSYKYRLKLFAILLFKG